MQKISSAVRVLTLLCYFMPFTFFFITCNKGWNFSYNRREAAKNVVEERMNGASSQLVDSAAMPADSASAANAAPVTKTDTTMLLPADTAHYYDTVNIMLSEGVRKDIWKDTSMSFSDKIAYTILWPTPTSASAFLIFGPYKTSFGKIVLGSSMMLSIMILIAGFFKKKRRRVVLIAYASNFVCITLFIADAVANRVDVLYGAWLCVTFIAAGMLLQYRLLKNQQLPAV